MEKIYKVYVNGNKDYVHVEDSALTVEMLTNIIVEEEQTSDVFVVDVTNEFHSL